VRKLIALVFNYSVNGLLADQGTDYYKFCFELLDAHGGPDRAEQTLDLLRNAHAHLMGRVAYEGISTNLPKAAEHPWSDIMNAGRKVVFSKSLRTAEWANTNIAAGDTTEEVNRLREGGEGHLIVWGGVSFWRSLMWLDLIDEFHLSVYPYVTDVGTRIFDGVPPSYRLDLLSCIATRSGVLELHYGRHRTRR